MRILQIPSEVETPLGMFLSFIVRTGKTILLFGILLPILFYLSPTHNISAAETKQKQITQTEASKGEQKYEDRDLAQLSLKINELSLDNLDMLKDIRKLARLQNVIVLLDKYSQASLRLEGEFREFEVDPNGTRRQLALLQSELENATLKVKQIFSKIAHSISKFDKWIDYWQAEVADFEAWEKGLGSSNSLPSVQHQLQQLQGVIQEAEKELDDYLQPLLKVQQDAGDIQLSMHRLTLKIDTLFETKFHFDHKSVQLLSRAFFSQFNGALWDQALVNAAIELRPNFSKLNPYKTQIVIVGVLFFTLITGMKRFRHTPVPSSGQKYLSQRPYSSIGFIALIALSNLCSDAGNWQLFFELCALFCLWRLVSVIVKNNKWKPIIKTLITTLVIYGFFLIIKTPYVVDRLLIVIVSVILIAIALFSCRRGRLPEKHSLWFIWLSRILIVILIVVIVAEMRGRSDLSSFLLSASVETLLSVVMVWVLFICISGLVEISLHSSRVRFFQKNAAQFYDMWHPLLLASAIFSLILLTLISWGVYPSGIIALESFSNLGSTIGDFKVSVGRCLNSLLFFYLAFCLSKLVEIILLDAILPSRNIHKGVQLSIARLSTYSILLVGFVGGLLILGFDMTNLTILGGAVGVGIGFGLQAIFSNLASGIILLFERPIKVGDVIMVGTDYGEVKKIGLRATIVETFDHSEIVVPNSALITSNVTNWTLGRRQVRLKVPIGVAYGSPIDRVLEIIIECALEHPRVLSTPKPSALFLAHGASSLDFELRAFVPDIDDRMSTISDLNKAINDSLDEEGIEIPFPQNDLHLKTVSSEVRAAMSSEKAQENNANTSVRR